MTSASNRSAWMPLYGLIIGVFVVLLLPQSADAAVFWNSTDYGNRTGITLTNPFEAMTNVTREFSMNMTLYVGGQTGCDVVWTNGTDVIPHHNITACDPTGAVNTSWDVTLPTLGTANTTKVYMAYKNSTDMTPNYAVYAEVGFHADDFLDNDISGYTNGMPYRSGWTGANTVSGGVVSSSADTGGMYIDFGAEMSAPEFTVWAWIFNSDADGYLMHGPGNATRGYTDEGLDTANKKTMVSRYIASSATTTASGAWNNAAGTWYLVKWTRLRNGTITYRYPSTNGTEITNSITDTALTDMQTFDNFCIGVRYNGDEKIREYVFGQSCEYDCIATIGANEDAGTSGTISITTPGNSTYYTPIIELNVTNTSAISAWYYSIDGAANTSFSQNVTVFMETGTHNITVYANETDNTWLTDSQQFTISYLNGASDPWASPVYETTNTTFQLEMNITNVSAINSIQAYLFWNSTNYTSSNVTSGTNWTFEVNVSVPLLPANDTNVSFYWEYHVSYNDSGYLETSNSTNRTQNLIYASWVDACSVAETTVLEGGYLNTTGTARDYSGGAVVEMAVWHNDSEYNMSFVSVASYLRTFSQNQSNMTPVGSGLTFYDVGVLCSLNVTFGGSSRSVNSSTTIVRVYKMLLGTCAGNTTQLAMEFFNFNETSTATAINASMEATFDIWDGSFYYVNHSVIFTANESHKVCIYPAWATFLVNATIEYDATGTNTRNYYMRDATINNVTSNINLYSVGDARDSQITFNVKDVYGNNQEDVIIKAQRYYTGTNTYLTVAMAMTDSNGDGATFLEKNVWYKFVLERAGVVLQTFTPSYLTADSIEFVLSDASLIEWFDYRGQVAYSCTYNDVSTVLRCVVSDTSGHMGLVTLDLYSLKALDFSEKIATTSATSSSATLTINLSAVVTGNLTGSYHYTLTGEFHSQDADWLLLTGTIETAASLPYGQSGVLVALLLILVLGMIGTWNPGVCVFMSVVGVFISIIFGLLDVGIGAFGGLMVAAAVIAYKLKT